jgi:mono/diheme cytochrome c family protein
MKRMTLIGILCCAGILTVGCRSVRRGEPITGVIPATTPALESGRMVYMQNCNQCHPDGEGGLGPALNNKPAPRFLMKTQVRLGLGAMPSFDETKISPEEMDELLNYVIALRKATEPKS